MNDLKDMRGVDIYVGDYVAYSKSNRSYPISMGTIVKVDDDYIHILGNGNEKVGMINRYYSKRIVVLPEEYRQDV